MHLLPSWQRTDYVDAALAAAPLSPERVPPVPQRLRDMCPMERLHESEWHDGLPPEVPDEVLGDPYEYIDSLSPHNVVHAAGAAGDARGR